MSDQDLVYKIGVVPQFTKEANSDAWHTDAWQTLISEYERYSSYRFTLAAVDSFEEFEKACARGEYDFVYLNPLQAHLLWKGRIYKPIAKDTGAGLQGIVVVRKDSVIKNLKELTGMAMDFSSPNSFSASMALRADMENLFGVNVKERYVYDQSLVYQNVAQGLAIAGGGDQITLSHQPAEIQKSLRVIYGTRTLPGHAFAVRANLPEPVIRHMQETLLKIGETAAGRSLLSAIHVLQIDVASGKDYDGIAAMQLRKWYQGGLR